MVQHCDMSVKVIILTFVIYSASGFNFSPKPNIIIKEPGLSTFQPKVESSYFGFTLNLRKSSIIVGAPRAQSTLDSQRHNNQTGAIYKCSLTGLCAPYVFEDKGDVYAENNDFSYDSEKRDYQWLGASMDGGPNDNDKLVVCAPRLIANLQSDYLMHGICYWTPDTLTDRPRNVKKIAPLRAKGQQTMVQNDKKYFYFMYGEEGISVHVTANNEEILIGAPGIHTWKGSVVRYYVKKPGDEIIMSRRDLSHQDAHRRVTRQSMIEYATDIPNPQIWDQPNDSYFGYSVGSGFFDANNRTRISYVATAPQANQQSGEAYIFDIVPTSSGTHTIRKYYTFHGTQFGEYFGYAVLAEDINGDGLTDVIVTAPLYSTADIVDQGAFYVFINKGRFVFELQKVIVSPIKGRGRFGSSITKLGDINRDGYNDIAVGAPFAGNGTVFVYLGGSLGLRELPSQKMSAVPTQSSYGAQMFGHGLSKGSDIDNNGFNDFAIGAPNAEAVYLYRAYPVVKILATINSLSREIKPNQNKFQFKICYMITTTSKKILNQDLAIKISVDPQVRRVTLQQTGTHELVFNATAITENQCRTLDAMVRFSTADIFKPIELEMHYDLINGVPNSEEFCDKCAAVDPAEPKKSSEKITFSTGCQTDVCIADLKVTSSGLSPTHILGSSRTITVTYDVSNSGETAYLPQINITSSNRMPLAKTPSNCKAHGHIQLCDLSQGGPLPSGSTASITIVYDASRIEGSSITLTATVFSTGKERDPSNNVVTNKIVLKEFTEIEATGKPQINQYINLEKTFNSAEVVGNYEVKSNGPSTIHELEVAFEIPVAYKFYGSSVTIPIIDINNITVQGVYDSQLLGVELYQNNTILVINPTEKSTLNGITSIDPESISNSDKLYSAGIRRTRRDISKSASKADYAMASQKKPHELLSEELLGILPINRTIVFSCIDPETVLCARAVLKVYNFVPNKPITLTLKYHVDLKEVNEILIEPWEFFVIVTKLDIVKAGDLKGKTTHITRKLEYNVISKHQIYRTPIWVIILAILGGLLVLAAVTYAMYKAGFFKRKTKEEMDKLVQERQQAGDETEDEG